jgi:glycosyltransferase involved in cell wall biosynthesis
MKKLSVIIPVFNEAVTIGRVMESVFAQKLPEWTMEVIVVDDGSTDNTQKILSKWAAKCKVIRHNTNGGKGSAVTEAFKYVTGDIILIQDADLEYSPADYPILLSPFEKSNVNVVYGSRFLGPHLSTMFIYGYQYPV